MNVFNAPRLKQRGSNNFIDITINPFSVGRSLSCHYVIVSNVVSRVHCVFNLNEDGWTLTDSSTNGTLVNGIVYKKTTTPILKEGDSIELTSDQYAYTFHSQINEVEISDQQLCDVAEKVETESVKHSLEVEPEASNPKKQKTKVDDQGAAGDKVLAVEGSSSHESSMETVENELTCSICSELFIKSVTLNCSHSFCKYCIDLWQKNKKVCPICRAKITSSNPTLVLDNFIEKVLEKATDETKEHRKKIIEDRTENTKSNDANKKPNNRRERPMNLSASTITINDSNNSVVEVSSDEADTVDDSSYFDEDDLEFFEEEYGDWEDNYDIDMGFSTRRGRNPYYGGYGACYACGETGHWANGCPNRNRRQAS